MKLGVEKSTGSFFYLIIILCLFIDITASFRNIDVDNSGHAAFDLDTVSIPVKILIGLSQYLKRRSNLNEGQLIFPKYL